MTLSCRSPVRGTSSLEMVYLSWREGSQLKINKAAICLQQPHRALALSFSSLHLGFSHFSVHFYFLFCVSQPSSAIISWLSLWSVSHLSYLSLVFISHVSPLVSVSFSLFILLSSVCFSSSHSAFLSLSFVFSLLSCLFVLQFFYQNFLSFSLSFPYFSASQFCFAPAYCWLRW